MNQSKTADSNLTIPQPSTQQSPRVRIPNHVTPALSELDLAMVRAVPPRGNWKDIPITIPSKRLKQIRESYAAGKGSRSTYYGRLHPDCPAYTISTYFNRPGNGCHIHYDYERGQHRLISQREAARLQSFPDSFVFHGNRGAVNQQIGNAVPPILAYQIARQLGEQGLFVDIFSGAGGLSLGFVWAGWTPILASDIDAKFLQTYAANIHPNVEMGDIRDRHVFNHILTAVQKGGSARPLFLLGGPPCQGFSTAGNRRSIEDERNNLFIHYKRLLAALKPDGFVFENVPGILNIMGGEVFRIIKQQLSSQGYKTCVWKLRAEEYGVPQRRTRVFIIGVKPDAPELIAPPPVTTFPPPALPLHHLSPCFSVREALDDLPAVCPGQDGSDLEYRHHPANAYQAFVRGYLNAAELLERLSRGNR